MSATTFDDFQREQLAAGASEVLVRDWKPDAVIDTHTHPFDASVRVVAGELWLTVGESTHHLAAGDTFSLAAHEPHAERYGPAGATIWVGRRSVD